MGKSGSRHRPAGEGNAEETAIKRRFVPRGAPADPALNDDLCTIAVELLPFKVRPGKNNTLLPNALDRITFVSTKNSLLGGCRCALYSEPSVVPEVQTTIQAIQGSNAKLTPTLSTLTFPMLGDISQIQVEQFLHNQSIFCLPKYICI